MSDANDSRPTLAEQRAFLLGTAEDVVRDRVEEDSLAHPEAYEALLALEQDLAETYAQGRLTAPERVAFEARLASDPKLRRTLEVVRRLDAQAPAPTPAGARRWWIWAAPAAAAVAVLFAVAPGAGPRSTNAPALDTPTPDALAPKLVAKGAEDPAQVHVRCLPRRCEVGARLALVVRPPPGRLHVAAFARRGDAPIRWFEPAADAKSAPVAAGGGPIPHTFAMDPNDGPGRFDVYVVFSAAGLGREQIAEAVGDDLEGNGSVTVVRRTVRFEAAR